MLLIIVMSNEKYIIKKQFLDRHRYQELLKHTYEYEQVFKTWLGQITEYYRGSIKPELINVIQKGMTHEFSDQGFHHLVYPFVDTLYNVSTQHMIYVTSVMRQSASMSLERDTDKMLQKIVKLSQSQFLVESTHRDILSSENRMALQPAQNIQFYSFSNWFKRLNVLEKYDKSVKMLEQAKQNKEKLYSMSQEVEYELMEFRKKIINYKYGYFKQGVKTARKLLSCLSEYFSIGIQILKKINGKYRMEMVNENRGSKQMRYSRGQVVDHLQDFEQNYAPKSQAYKTTLTNIQNLFVYENTKVDKQALFFKFREMYSGNQNLLDEMFDVYELFETMSKKRKIMYDRISSIISVIQMQHKSKKKTAQVLGVLNRKKVLQYEGRNLASSGTLQRSQQFDQEFGMEKIQKMICQVVGFSLKCFTEMSQVCYKLTFKITQQLKADRSGMEVSYQYTQVKIKNKRPSKEEVWLWKDWRDFRVFEDVSPKLQQKHILNELTFIRKIMQKEQSQEKFDCQIEGRHKGKAVLSVYTDKVAVQGKKENSNYFIMPYKNIDCIESSKKKLIFKMHGGCELKLSQFKSVVEVQKKINEYFLGNQGPTANGPSSNILVEAKPAIVITPEQLQAIQKRAPQIEKIRPKAKEYTKYGQTKLPGVTIQEVYQFIFSDKDSSPVSPTTSFFKYTNVKNKNTNVTDTKYNAQGPYFYTGTNKSITFVNAPLFSSRQSELDHPLPAIPFLPKSIHCKSKQKLIWVSNKQFQYVADVYSEGHKMMESFYTSTMYQVKELPEGGVSMEIMCKIQFIKDASMKSILVNGAVGEIKKIVPDIIKQIQKCCKVGLRLRSRQSTQGGAVALNNPEQGNKILQELEKSQEKVSSPNPDNQKITINYYSIILIVIGTIMLNLLVNWLL